MAYCMSCGAYIPDGQTKCLACGYDEAAKTRQEKKYSDSGSAYRFDNEDLRQKLEQQRQAQQEQSRKWAEEEYARRQKQEENRKWAEEEYARRQAQREQQAQSYVNRSATTRRSNAASGTGNKLLASLSYLSLLFLLPMLASPDDKFAQFHAKQGVKLFVFGLLVDILGGITGFGWVLSLIRFYLIYKGMSNALNGKTEPLPIIGNFGENQ